MRWLTVLFVGLVLVAGLVVPATVQAQPQTPTTTTTETANNTTTTTTDSTPTTTTTQTPTTTPTENDSDGGTNDPDVSLGSLLRVGDNGGPDASTVVIDLKAYGHIYNIEYNSDGGYAWVYVSAERPATLTFSDGNDRNDGGVSRVYISSQTVPEGEYRYKVQTDAVNDRQCIIVDGDGTPADYGLRHCSGDAQNSFFSGEVPMKWVFYGLGAFLLGTLVYVGRRIRRENETGDVESAVDGSTISETDYGSAPYTDSQQAGDSDA